MDDRRRARVLYVEPLGNEAVNRRRVNAGYDLMSFLLHDARRRRGGSPDGDPIGATSAAALIGGLSEIVTAWIDGHIRADRADARRRRDRAVRRAARRRQPDRGAPRADGAAR